LPVLAAAYWGSVSVVTKYLSRREAPEAVTLHVLVLITPNHFLIGLLIGIAAMVLPEAALRHALPRAPTSCCRWVRRLVLSCCWALSPPRRSSSSV
jgi:drug/metabolite transporter (DMT)-like permease